MKKSIFTNVLNWGECTKAKTRTFSPKQWQLFFLLPLFLLLTVTTSKAQNGICALSCNNQVNISLDVNGEAEIVPEIVWENANTVECLPLITSISLSVDGIGAGTSILADCDDIGLHGYNLEVEFFVVDASGAQVLDPTGAPLTYTNSCWGEILIEDKIGPQIECETAFIECNAASDPANAGFPNATDNCAIVDTDFTDVVTDLGCADIQGYQVTTQIDRTWTVYDAAGFSATCTQTIYIFKPTLSEVVFPGNLDDLTLPALNCNSLPTLQNAGQPLINGLPIVNGDICNIAVTYEDNIVELCGGSTEVLRTWTVADWCTGEVINYIQIIKLLDKTAPYITCPADITVGTDINDCSTTVNLLPASVSDDCSGFSVVVETPLGSIDGNGGLLVDAPLGAHTITYIATDECGNASSCSMTVTVVDNVPPIAVCDEHTTVAIGADGTALIGWDTFDDGSHDNCELVKYEVRRMDNPGCPGNDATDFDEVVPVTCCDIGSVVIVELQVTDAAGLTNSCMVEVEVQDKIYPTIVCPANKTLDCGQDYTDTGLTGVAIGTDNCPGVEVTYEDIFVDIDQCGEGVIRRRWTATDAVGKTDACVQIITIDNSTPFEGDDITWPDHYETAECGAAVQPQDLPAGFDRPQFTEDACDLVALTHVDEVLEVQGEACYKIVRTWIVINWCEYDPNDPQTGGRWEFEQIIKVLNEVAPVITSTCQNVDICNYEDACAGTFVDLPFAATDDCTPAADLIYSFILDVNNDGLNDVYGNTNDASNYLPNGVHSLSWEVADGCGNVTTCSYLITVRDCKQPTPVCINGLSAELMPTTGQVTLWVSDFESGSSFDNCTSHDNLEFSFSSNVNDKNKVFDCSQLGTQIVQIWATDEAGNQDYCETYIIIQDNMGACDGVPTTSAMINGRIENELGEEVEEVSVNISGSNALPFMTETDGSYAFPSLPMHGNYTVTPEKDMNPTNGVSTFDLVKIQKHILGVETLDSPYKMIAADINRSGSITTFDVVRLRKLILNIDTEFEDNTSWRFIDKNFVFADPTDPFATSFPEVVSINDLSQDEAANFVAIKVGDVNNTAIPNTLLGVEGRTTVGDLLFNVEDKALTAGEEYTVTFEAKDAVLGYQFTLNFDKNAVAFVSIEQGSAENFGLTMLDEGVITISWNATTATQSVFSLSFKALADVQLSEVLNINSKYTTSEAYNSDADLMDVALAFNGELATASFELYQNTPNPFKTTTTVGFNLPDAGTATLTVYDLSGKVLKLISTEYAKGYNEIELNRAELSGSGVLYYQLDTTTGSATKKMLLVD